MTGGGGAILIGIYIPIGSIRTPDIEREMLSI
jgi:hypothetical protein